MNAVGMDEAGNKETRSWARVRRELKTYKKHFGPVTAAVGLLVAVIGTVVAFIALVYSARQLNLSNQLAWSYDGGAQCSAYRSEVLELWKQGLTAAQIREWFSGEAGGARNEYGSTSVYQTAIEDFEHDCGAIEGLLQTLPPTPRP